MQTKTPTNYSPRTQVGSLWIQESEGLNFGSTIFLSILLHLLLVGLIAGTIFLMQFFGFKIPLFDPLAMKPRDLEFVLVDNPTAPPRNKQTKNRADRATRAGGKKVPNRAQAEPQQMAGSKATKPAPSRAPTPKATPQKPQPKATPQPKVAVTKPAPTPQPAPKPVAKPTPAPAPKMPTPPTKIKTAQAPALPPNPLPSAIRTPAPPTPKAVATGPIVSTPGSGGSGSGQTGRRSPGPSQVPGSVSGASGGSGSPGSSGTPGSRPGSGGSGSYSQAGSPGGGGGRAGIDALPEPDFGPYIAELQRRIKRNWTPPADNKNLRIVALFTIARDGRLIKLRLQQTSGVAVADEAALMAVRSSAPFRPLPANYRGSDIDVQFIFDYNVLTGRSSGISRQ